MPNEFQGFPKAAVTFLKQLNSNNDTTWYKEHKSDYEKSVLEPAKAFVMAMYEKLTEIAPNIAADTRTNGAGSIFRIYRDVRFSKDKTPYKTFLGIFFWEGTRKKMENSGFYFHLDPSQNLLMLAAGMHILPKPHLQVFRDAVVDDKLGKGLIQAVEKVAKDGSIEVGGKYYKRTPREYDPEHPMADYLLYNALWTSHQSKIPDALFTSKAVDYCFDRFKTMAPIHHWLVEVMKDVQTTHIDSIKPFRNSVSESLTGSRISFDNPPQFY